MARRLLLLLLALLAGTALAELLGAENLGTALGIGQLAFAATLVGILLLDRGR
jgi:hypothetical protein